MLSLLGRIKQTRKSRRRDGAALQTVRVKFRPVCVLPGRDAVPEWLKDQTLEVTRKVADPREVGGVGDSVVATPAEAAPWLRPLVVEPALARGKVPARLTVRLRWCKDKKPGEVSVRMGGRQRTLKLRNEGGEFRKTFTTRSLLDAPPTLPTQIEVSLGKQKARCVVLPAGEALAAEVPTPLGAHRRVESGWYELDVCTGRYSGAVSRLAERARGAVHFAPHPSHICQPLAHGGYHEQVSVGWDDGRPARAAAKTVTARHEADGTHIHATAVVDEGQGIRTAWDLTVFDELPLMLSRRSVTLEGPKQQKKDDKNGPEKPKEPVDALVTLRMGWRLAVPVAADGSAGQICALDGERLAVRQTAWHDPGWDWPFMRLQGGWAVLTRPQEALAVLCAFAPTPRPSASAHRDSECVAATVWWGHRNVRPGDGIGSALALVAGELAGAEAAGAWVAARRPAPGGVECCLIGRFSADAVPAGAEFTLGRHKATAPLQPLTLPSVGRLHVATTVVARGGMKTRFDARAGTVPARR